ncbi:hypothetical protein SFRURICE_003326 [Spodoptera frugiperda]|nr:hypothetical protein SFRURICE_003326 [Spodoptera frugiperda]
MNDCLGSRNEENQKMLLEEKKNDSIKRLHNWEKPSRQAPRNFLLKMRPCYERIFAHSNSIGNINPTNHFMLNVAKTRPYSSHCQKVIRSRVEPSF